MLRFPSNRKQLMFFQNIFWNRKHLINQFKQERTWSVTCTKELFVNVLCNFLIKIKSTWRREIKEQTPQLTLLCCGRTVRSSHRRCSIKKLLLKISQCTQETPFLNSLFKNLAGLKACNFTKKRPQHKCFLVNIAKYLRLQWNLSTSDTIGTSK